MQGKAASLKRRRPQEREPRIGFTVRAGAGEECQCRLYSSVRIHNEESTHPPPGAHPRYAHAPDHNTALHAHNQDGASHFHHDPSQPTRFHFQARRISVGAHATVLVAARRCQKPERTRFRQNTNGDVILLAVRCCEPVKTSSNLKRGICISQRARRWSVRL